MENKQTGPKKLELDVEFNPEDVAAAARAIDELCQQSNRRSLFGRRATASTNQHSPGADACTEVLGSLVEIGGAQ